MSIVVVGTVAFDTIEAPWGKAERVIGGSATYFSLAASHFTPVKLVAVVGADLLAEHRAILEDRGVDLEGLVVESGGKTFFWAGRYGEDPNERETLVHRPQRLRAIQAGASGVVLLEPVALPRQHRPRYPDEPLDQVEGRPFVGSTR